MYEASIECTHERCNCSVIAAIDGGDAYCSGYCRTATEESVESETCACGHPQCDAV
ncbi:MAG: hypothetical protein JO104_03850 [Candidatus Eremiobacteraeota bacterium]|nr:hypothetical protein [Candidatus Eremiobacteraeota bacterium]